MKVNPRIKAMWMFLWDMFYDMDSHMGPESMRYFIRRTIVAIETGNYPRPKVFGPES